MQMIRPPGRETTWRIVDTSVVAMTALALLLAVLVARGQSPFRLLAPDQSGSTRPSSEAISATVGATSNRVPRIDGEGRYPASADGVALGPNVQATVLVTDPADASAYRYLDVALSTANSAVPATGLGVHATARMDGMNGSVEGDALARGDGHYFIPLQFPMAGTWHVIVVVQDRSGEQTLPLDLVVR